MSEFDANIELARRADLARRTGCEDRPDPHSASRGIINGVLIGGALWLAFIVLGTLAVGWLGRGA